MDQYFADVTRLFELVSGIQIRARRTIETGLRSRDLTYAQYSALLALAAKNGMSQAELAQALDTDSTTAMVLRTSLERKKLVGRVDDPEDGRVKRIEISDAGKSALQSATPESKSLFTKAGAILSEAELKKVLPVLERLYAFVGETSLPKKDDNRADVKKGRPRKEGARVQKAAPKAPAKAAKKGEKPAVKAKATAKAPSKAKPVAKAASKPVAKPAAKAKTAPKAPVKKAK